MSDLSNKCVLLKGLPSCLEQTDVINILQSKDFYNGVDKVEAHIEKSDDKRWIVLFKTEEDAARCFNHGHWTATVSEQTVRVVPDFCSECIIPDKWATELEPTPDRSWVMIEQDNYSSVSSGELFAGESMPFQISGSENTGEQIKETFVYRNDLDDDDLPPKPVTGKISPVVLEENFSESGLFGSGYKKNIISQDCPKDNTETRTVTTNVAGVYETPKIRELAGNSTNISSGKEAKIFQAYVKDLPKIQTKTFVVKDRKDNEIVSGDNLMKNVPPSQGNGMVHETNSSPTQKSASDITTADRICDGKNETERNVGNTEKYTYQVPKGTGFEHTDKKSQQGPSQAQIYPEALYTHQPYGIPMHLYYPGYTPGYAPFGPMPAFDQMAYYMAFPNVRPPQPQGQSEAQTSNMPDMQGFSHQMPFYPPMFPYMIPPFAQPQIYGQNVPMISGQTPTSGEMSGPVYSEAVDHDNKIPVSRKEEDELKPKEDLVDDNDIQDYLCPISRQDTCSSKGERKLTEPRSDAIENCETGVKKARNSEPSGKRQSVSKNIRIDPSEIPRIPQKKPTSKQEEDVEDHIYEEIPADKLSLDQEFASKHQSGDQDFVLRQTFLKRILPPVPQSDRKSLLVQDKQSSSNTTGDKRKSWLVTETPVDKLKEPTPDDDEDFERDVETIAKRKEEATNKIIVTGFRESTSLESLGFFFENKRKSGGDEIVTTERLKDPDALVIEFQNSSVVESVLQKQEGGCLKLDDAVLKVRPYIPPPIDEYRLFLVGVKDGVSRESLEIFIEVASGLCPISVEGGETPGTFMLTFEEAPDFNKLQQMLTKRTLEDGVVTASQVKVSSSVQVSGYDSNVTEDMLVLYFENKKRSGGGEVVHIKKEKTRCIIQFRYSEDAMRVCGGKSQRINDRELHVSLYHKCMDLEKDFELKIPDPLIMQNVNPNIIKFMVRSSKYKETFATELENAFGIPDWSSSDENKLVITCTLDPKERESVQLVKRWELNCCEVVNRFLETLDVNEDIIVHEEVWPRSLEALQDVDVPNPDDVAVFIKKEELNIVVCGEKHTVATVSEKISGILEDVEKQAMDDSKEIKKTVQLKMYQIALLNSLKFFDPKNFSASKVTVDIRERRQVIFSGQKCNIDRVISTMNEQLKGFTKRSFVAGKLFQNMLFEKAVRDYIKTQMMKQKIMGVWDIVKGDDNVYMHSKTDKQVQAAIDVVNKCLVQKTVPLDLKMEDQIEGLKGKKLFSELQEKHDGLLKLEKSTGQLMIITVDYLLDKVYEEIKQFLDLHTISEEFIDVSSGRLYFINQFFHDRLDRIENQYKSLSVVIEERETQYRQGFKVKGQKDGCKLAIKQLQKLVEDVCTDEYEMESKDTDLKQFFKSNAGRKELTNIEMKEKCVLKIKPDKDMPDRIVKQHALTTRAECTVNNCKILVMEGDMSELHDKVDVLVIPRNLYMTNTEGLTGAVMHKGGFDIQKECESYQKHHDMSYGDVFVSSVGKLQCKHIFHAISPEWRKGYQNEENLLRITVKNCLDKMTEKKLKSIALSALSTGRFMFPPQKALTNIVSVLNEFVTGAEANSVKEIYLCDIKGIILTGFIDELKRTFKDVKEIDTPDSNQRTYEKERGSHESSSPSSLRRQRGRRSQSDDQDIIIKTVIVKGELARQKADVIVNSTNANLDLKVGHTSRSLLKVGGEIVQQDLQQKYPDGIQIGDIAVSVGGSLKCREIFHGVLVKYDQGQGTAEKIMETFVKRCLKLADKRGMNSIAFPALGTGMLGFPADRVAWLFFETVQEYERKNPDTGLTSVLLVVYQDDMPTYKAFSFIDEKIKSGDLGDRVRSRQSYSFAGTFSMAPGDLNSHQFNIGPVVVNILQGDITKEKTDIVVNSTTEELNLSAGAVSKAILDAAGSSLQAECHSVVNRAKMKRNGYIITYPGNMMCGKILHIKARSSTSGWEKTVMDCLKLVEAHGSSSVSFPALGTGGKGCSPDSVAKAMLSAFRSYIQSSDYMSTLKTIRIVIYQADMVKAFVAATQEDSRSSWKFLERFRQRQKPSKIIFRIYADSQYRLIKVRDLLRDIFGEETLYSRKRIVDDLKDRQVDKIKRMGHEKNVSVDISSRDGSIKLHGPTAFVKEVKDEIAGYLRNIEKDVAMAAARAAISLPKSWGKMGLQDPTRVVVLPPNDNEYICVQTKFQAQAAGSYTNIVKIERIQSPTLYTQYMAKKKQMEQASPGRNIEQILWHGTKGHVVANINNKGFDRNYNSGASHGVGVYFAVNARTSVQGYCQQDAWGQRHIYLARVLTGEYTVGVGASRLPPPKPTGNPMDRYDSSTDNMTAPNFFVIFHDAQAYPEFLITFI